MSLQVAYELAREASAHKRQAQAHRRIVQRKLDELRQLCAHLGLDLNEVRMNATEGDTAHGRISRTD